MLVLFVFLACGLSWEAVQGQRFARLEKTLNELAANPGPPLEKVLVSLSSEEQQRWRSRLFERALRGGNASQVEYWLQHGVSPDDRSPEGFSWLVWSLYTSNVVRPEIRCVLIEHTHQPNAVHPQGSRSVLQMAVLQGDAASTKLLVRKGANPNQQDGNGVSPLSLAREKHPELVSLLVQK